MWKDKEYKILNRQSLFDKEFCLTPIRYEDRFDIMKWRNEQMYHLRQNAILTIENQENYFSNVVLKLFEQDRPTQILFSFLEGDKCIGYGGLVHINWIDKNAEISFIMNTVLEESSFEFYWVQYLDMIKKVAFIELGLHKIFTYAFDLRPRLYNALLQADFIHEATLKEHCLFKGQFIDVLIHSYTFELSLHKAIEEDVDVTFKWASDQKIREYSFNKETIVYENHKQWFLNKISSSETIYFILKNFEGSAIGSIRIDFNKDLEAWVISYLIDSSYHGKGLGIQLLALLEKEIKEMEFDVTKLVGIVQDINNASLSIFRKLGYIESKEGKNYIFTKEI